MLKLNDAVVDGLTLILLPNDKVSIGINSPFVNAVAAPIVFAVTIKCSLFTDSDKLPVPTKALFVKFVADIEPVDIEAAPAVTCTFCQTYFPLNCLSVIPN